MEQDFVIKDNQPKDSGFGAIVSDFGQSLFHSAIESPVNGVTQLINDVTGTNMCLSGDRRTNIKPLTIVGAPSAPTSTADSYAEKIGGAIGMVVPYFLISKGVGKVVGGLADTSLAKSLSMTPFLESFVARAGLSGAVYGGIFNPVARDEKNHSWARLRNAAVDGATFATLTGTSEALAKLGIFKPTTSALSDTVKAIGTTVIAGVPAGVVSAEGQSLLGQGRFSTGSELKQSAIDFVTIGGALATLTHGVSATQGAWRSQLTRQDRPEAQTLLESDSRGRSGFMTVKQLDQEVAHELGSLQGPVQVTAQAVLSLLESDPPPSMTAKAYKVLTASGRSPWCHREKWSLPTQQSDGTFLPGDWAEAKPRFTFASLFYEHQPGLYVSRDPRYWWFKNKSRVVYEAEIGDPFSLAHWNDLPAVDFVAQKVRLLRPMPPEAIWKFHEENPYFVGAENVRLPLASDIKSGQLPIKRRIP